MEVAGLVIGGVSMAALVEVCTQTFDRIQSIRKYGRDYQKYVLKLSLLQLRLTRWVAGVTDVVNQKNIVIGTSEEAQQVQELLGDIAATIQRAEKAAMRHNTAKMDEDHVDDGKDGATFDMLAKRVKTLALRRQKTSSFSQRTRWALRDQNKLKNLVNDLGESISDLEQLFPPEQMLMIAESRKQLAKAEVFELIQPSEIEEPKDGETLVSILEDAAADVDKVLTEAVEIRFRETRTDRHVYGDIHTSDTAKVSVGDYIAAGHQQSGPGHRYGQLNATGDSRVHLGDSFGGKSVFEM